MYFASCVMNDANWSLTYDGHILEWNNIDCLLCSVIYRNRHLTVLFSRHHFSHHTCHNNVSPTVLRGVVDSIYIYESLM